MHYFDPHGPYTPPSEFRIDVDPPSAELKPQIKKGWPPPDRHQPGIAQRLSSEDLEYLQNLYKGEIRFTDHFLGQLLATIYHAFGIEPQTIVYNHLNQPRELVKSEAVTSLFA